MLRKVGSWIGAAKRYVNNFQDQVSALDKENIDVNIDEANNKQSIKKGCK